MPALMQPYLGDAELCEHSYTTGTGPYTLAGAMGTFLPLSERYADGTTVTYWATDRSGQSELCSGTYSAAGQSLTRTLLVSTTGALINWTGRTLVFIEPVASPLPLCATPPLDGQVLIWSAADNAYCPADFCSLVAACRMTGGAVKLGPPAPVCGFDWTQQTNVPGTLVPNHIAVSNDSQTIIVTDTNLPQVYKSTDGGATWGTITPPVSYTFPWDMATDNSLQHIIIGGGGAGLHDHLFLSIDGGTTWTTITLTSTSPGIGAESHFTVGMSGDGNTIIVGGGGTGGGAGTVWVSTDAGGTFVEQIPSLPVANGAPPSLSNGWAVAMSRDASMLMGVCSEVIYYSRDFGGTWNTTTAVPNASVHGALCLAASAGGATIWATPIVISAPDYLYKSTDFGVTWTQVTSAGNLYWFASEDTGMRISDDGQTILATGGNSYTGGGSVYLSCDGGATWHTQFVLGNNAWSFGAPVGALFLSANGLIAGAAPLGPQTIPFTGVHQ